MLKDSKIHELKTARLFQVALAGFFAHDTPECLVQVGPQLGVALGSYSSFSMILLNYLTEFTVTKRSQPSSLSLSSSLQYYPARNCGYLKISQTFNLQNLNLVWRPYFLVL